LRFFLLDAGLANGALLGDDEMDGKAAAEAAALCVKSYFDAKRLYRTSQDRFGKPSRRQDPAET